jgi:hypothetical protein
MDVLVIMNSGSNDYRKGREYLLPFLNHFGIPYVVYDVAKEENPGDAAGHSLLILAHPGIFQEGDTTDSILISGILAAVDEGTGLVSFDPSFLRTRPEPDTVSTVLIRSITFKQSGHYITLNHTPADTLRFFEAMPLARYEFPGAGVLAASGDLPLLAVKERGQGRIACWTSMDWMHSNVLGPLGGLDDCLWRSLVWAARKPFVMQGLPPMITMRVDDVAGRGGLWNRSPLYWVGTANKYGLKPWLGLFIYNLNPQAVNELRAYLLSGNATASPHAFGRPPRHDAARESYLAVNPLDTVPFYYNPESIPLRADSYDEFIFYNHHQSRAWPDSEALAGLEAVDRWYQANAPLPMCEYLVPHWYEMGANTARYTSEKWGMKYSCFPKYGDSPYADTVMWLRSGPFRLFEEPQTCTGWTRQDSQRPVYYAGFIEFGGATFFNCLTEIRDDAGYEWAPDNNIDETVGRGTRQLKRALDAMALPVLFTHETDYIYRIRPENWDRELMLITRAVAPYNPEYLTMDQALRITRAVATSDIVSVNADTKGKVLRIGLEGKADTTTVCYLFTEEEGVITSQLITIPAFKGRKMLEVGY